MKRFQAKAFVPHPGSMPLPKPAKPYDATTSTRIILLREQSDLSYSFAAARRAGAKIHTLH
jgi:hypothetical protein